MTLFKIYLFKSISVHQLANKSWVGTLRKLTADGSFASGESGSLVMENTLSSGPISNVKVSKW